MAESLGVSIKSADYTMGTHDLVLTVEGPEEASMVALLKVGSLGNVRSQTLRAFTPEEMRRMLGQMS